MWNLLKKKIWFLIKFIIPMRQDCIGNVSQQRHLLHAKKEAEKSTPGYKLLKEYITIMCCGNASGNPDGRKFCSFLRHAFKIS